VASSWFFSLRNYKDDARFHKHKIVLLLFLLFLWRSYCLLRDYMCVKYATYKLEVSHGLHIWNPWLAVFQIQSLNLVTQLATCWHGVEEAGKGHSIAHAPTSFYLKHLLSVSKTSTVIGAIECTVNRVEALKDFRKTVREFSEISLVQQTRCRLQLLC